MVSVSKALVREVTIAIGGQLLVKKLHTHASGELTTRTVMSIALGRVGGRDTYASCEPSRDGMNVILQTP